MSKSSDDDQYSRRDVIKFAGVSALGVLLSGMPPLRGGLFAATGGGLETTKLKFGIIPLTDCAPIVIAAAKGYFKKYGLDVTVSKEQAGNPGAAVTVNVIYFGGSPECGRDFSP